MNKYFLFAIIVLSLIFVGKTFAQNTRPATCRKEAQVNYEHSRTEAIKIRDEAFKNAKGARNDGIESAKKVHNRSQTLGALEDVRKVFRNAESQAFVNYKNTLKDIKTKYADARKDCINK